MKIASMLEVGGVVVGGPPGQRTEWMPFGGIKASGIGRMGVLYMYDELTVLKTILIPCEGRG